MCQFTPKDPVKKHRPGTRCRYTGQIAGHGGFTPLLLILMLAVLLTGAATYFT